MKKWWLLLSLGVCLSAFADNQNKSCEFLVEGGNPITDTHLGFADGVVSLEGCEEGLFVFSDTTSPQRQVGFVDKFRHYVAPAQELPLKSSQMAAFICEFT